MVVDVDCRFDIFNDELVDKLFKLLNGDVDVDCRFDIFNYEFVDKLFKLLNIDDVDCRFDIFNVEFVDNEFRLLDIIVVVAFKLLIDNIVFGPTTEPPTFNVDNKVA
jgi:hypothetical protein